MVNSGAETTNINEIFTGPPNTQITLDTRELNKEPSEYLTDDWVGFVEPPKSAQNTEEPRLVDSVDIGADSVVKAINTLEVSISEPPGDRLDSVDNYHMDDYTQQPPARSALGPEDPLVDSADIGGVSAGYSDIGRLTPEELIKMMNEETDEYLDYRAGLITPPGSVGVEINILS